MAAVTVFCKKDSNRFRYVLDWVFKEVLHVSYDVTDDETELPKLDFFVSYGTDFKNAFSIPDSGLLWEKDVTEKETAAGEWKQIPTFFHHAAAVNSVPFDLFSALFFLICRYEEYYSYTPDKHGRYPATNSVLYENDCLERPIIDEWLYELYLILKDKNIPVQLTPFKFVPTYDIDMAYSYKHKGLRRNIGGFVRDFLKGDFSSVRNRKAVLLQHQLDPFDAFVGMKKLHSQHLLKPIYFILAALKKTAFDKNISPENEAMQKLIFRLSKEGYIGLHPSYYSYQEAVFKQEKDILQRIIGVNIIHSRQHYIKLNLPATYRMLIKYHIQHDYSMGYGSHLGFRAGTGRSFLWYDLEREETTKLRIHPFCFMDSTALFEQNYSPKAAFERLNKMTSILKTKQSDLITVLHNFSLGGAKQWEGWKEQYERFVEGLNEN